MITAEYEAQTMLADDIGSFSLDPLGFVQYAYPWGEGELADFKGPRAWQAEILAAIRDHLQNPATRFQPLMVAVSSGKGIGKSAEISWLANWAMSTCEDCKVVLTANTKDQLRTKTWPEVQKWFRLSINADWWSLGATAITARDEAHAKLWRADMLAWNVANPQAFAGLHNLGKRIVLLLDEASEIADKIWEVAEGALTDENTEIIWIAFGNPTQNTGRFRECFGKFKHRWITRQIDSRKVDGTNKAQIDKWIADYGEDSDYVRVLVRGEFPRAGLNQFISSEAVEHCRKYKAEGFAQFSKVFGVDVARFGDDRTCIIMRQGRKATLLGQYRGLDTAQVTAQVIEFIDQELPDAVVVDSDGIGNTVFDQLKFRGYGKRLFEFHGGKPANNAGKYFNQRSEIWGLMRDALEAEMEIPDDPELAGDLTGPTYGFSPQQQIQLEKKDDMKKRGLSSPDKGDALAMTFAVKVLPKDQKRVTKYVYPGQQNQSWMG